MSCCFYLVLNRNTHNFITLDNVMRSHNIDYKIGLDYPETAFLQYPEHDWIIADIGIGITEPLPGCSVLCLISDENIMGVPFPDYPCCKTTIASSLLMKISNALEELLKTVNPNTSVEVFTGEDMHYYDDYNHYNCTLSEMRDIILGDIKFHARTHSNYHFVLHL